eukprot:6193267-Pleurochrysis_carterae.AAC.1
MLSNVQLQSWLHLALLGGACNKLYSDWPRFRHGAGSQLHIFADSITSQLSRADHPRLDIASFCVKQSKWTSCTKQGHAKPVRGLKNHTATASSVGPNFLCLLEHPVLTCCWGYVVCLLAYSRFLSCSSERPYKCNNSLFCLSCYFDIPKAPACPTKQLERKQNRGKNMGRQTLELPGRSKYPVQDFSFLAHYPGLQNTSYVMAYAYIINFILQPNAQLQQWLAMASE